MLVVASKASSIGDASPVEILGCLETLDMPEDPSAGVEREPPRDAGVDDGGVAYERHASMLDRRSSMRSIFLSLQASFSTRVPLRG